MIFIDCWLLHLVYLNAHIPTNFDVVMESELRWLQYESTCMGKDYHEGAGTMYTDILEQRLILQNIKEPIRGLYSRDYPYMYL
jgi:hypothetical protein